MFYAKSVICVVRGCFIIGSSEFIHGAHGGHGSSEFRRMLNGYFLGGCFARNLGGNLRTLWSRNQFTIIFKENPYQNAQQYVAFGEGLIMDRLTGSKS